MRPNGITLTAVFDWGSAADGAKEINKTKGPRGRKQGQGQTTNYKQKVVDTQKPKSN